MNTESTYDWTNKQWTVPLNLSVAQLFKPKTVFGLPFPIQLQGGVRYYVWKPQNGPDFGVRLTWSRYFLGANKLVTPRLEWVGR